MIALTLITPVGDTPNVTPVGEAPKQVSTPDKNPRTVIWKPLPRPSAAPAGSAGRKGSPKATKHESARHQSKGVEVGILAILKSSTQATTKILGPGRLDEAINRLADGLRGTAQGEQQGTGGLGSRGTDKGGGGDTQGIDPFGRKDGVRTLGGVDLGTAERGERQVEVERRGHTGDGLSREHIQRVLERARSRFQHCYEKELGRSPDLHGKVALAFTINGDGTVDQTDAHGTIIEVEACVQRVARTLHFDAPRGGGSVNVRYPLVFTTLSER